MNFLDSNIIFPFSDSIGTEVTIEMGSYEIKTDTGMTPFITEVSEEGFYVADKISGNYFIATNGTQVIF